jgi:uncharacterized protein (TIGR03000 family)
MSARRFSLLSAAALSGAIFVLSATAGHAQPPIRETNMPYTSAGPVAAGPLPGYSGLFPTPVSARSPLRTQLYGTRDWSVVEVPSSVYYTSINYPGQYGTQTLSVAALAYNTRPSGINSFDVAEATFVQSPREIVLRAAEVAPPLLPEKDVARVTVLLPSEAVLTFEGVRMPQTGSFREFVTPALATGRDYTYHVRATWTENGEDVTREQTIRVRPGERTDVDFMNPPNAAPGRDGTSTLRTRPLP